MVKHLIRIVLVVLGLLSLTFGSLAAEEAHTLDIYLVDPSMNERQLLTADLDNLPLAEAPIVNGDDIIVYEWKSHKMKVRQSLIASLQHDEGIGLGRPFVAVADGVRCYAGAFVSTVSSMSWSVPVIVLGGSGFSWSELSEDEIQISLGYPTSEFFQGTDPRSDERIREALAALDKLR